MVVGNIVYTSGQIPINPASGEIEAKDIESQTEQVCKNLCAVLEAAGTSIEKVDEAYAKLHPDTTFYAAITGVYVSATNPDLNAAQYIQINDIITEINEIPVTNIYEVMDIINQYDGGDSVSVKYYRNGVYNTVDVILGNE